MANHIVVDFDTLATLATSLTSMSDELNGCAARVDGARASIGAATVKSALDRFDDNWTSHRRRLVESIDAVQKMASETEQKFSDADRELANLLLDRTPPQVTEQGTTP